MEYLMEAFRDDAGIRLVSVAKSLALRVSYFDFFAGFKNGEAYYKLGKRQFFWFMVYTIML